MSIPLIKKVDLSRPRFRRRPVRAFRYRQYMSGGPIDIAWLSTPGTLVFTLGDWRGYYNGKNEWVQI
jgi:hypothetical protein